MCENFDRQPENSHHDRQLENNVRIYDQRLTGLYPWDTEGVSHG